MRIALEIGDDVLRRRVLRVLEAFPDIDITVDADLIAGPGGDIELPDEPTRHLSALLAEDVLRRTGRPTEGRAATLADEPLRSGTPITFPPPLGALWAERIGNEVLAPTSGSFAGALASNDSLTLAVVDDRQFLDAIVTAGPIIARAMGITELDAVQKAGLALAERG